MTQYVQTEFCLDLSQGNTDSLPTWMKNLRDRPSSPPSFRPLQIQPPIFDLTPYASTQNATTSKTKASRRADRNKQVAVSTP